MLEGEAKTRAGGCHAALLRALQEPNKRTAEFAYAPEFRYVPPTSIVEGEACCIGTQSNRRVRVFCCPCEEPQPVFGLDVSQNQGSLWQIATSSPGVKRARSVSSGSIYQISRGSEGLFAMLRSPSVSPSKPGRAQTAGRLLPRLPELSAGRRRLQRGRVFTRVSLLEHA